MNRLFMALTLLMPLVSLSAQEATEAVPRQVRSIAFSSDGRLLAATGGNNLTDGRLLVWETDSFRIRWQHDEPVGFAGLAFSPDGQELALARFAPEAKVFDVATGKIAGELEGHWQYVQSVAYSPNGARVVTGSNDGTILIWNRHTCEFVSRIVSQNGPIYQLAISRDGTLLASANAGDHSVTLWNLSERRELHRVEDVNPHFPYVAFSPDGNRLAVSGWGGQLRHFDTRSYELLACIEGIGPAHWAEHSPDGRWLAVVTNTIQLYLYWADRTATPEIRAHVDQLLDRFDEDSYEAREQASHELAQIGPAAETQLLEALNSPSAETRIRARRLYRRLYDPAFAVELRGHQDELQRVTFSPDGKLLASGDRTGTIIVWRVADWQPVAILSLKN